MAELTDALDLGSSWATQQVRFLLAAPNHYIYALTDIAITLLVLSISFLCVYGFEGFKSHIAPVMIYCGGMS